MKFIWELETQQRPIIAYGDFPKKSISRVLLPQKSPLKRESSLKLKLVLTGDLLLMRRISLDYFFHHQGFVYHRPMKRFSLRN